MKQFGKDLPVASTSRMPRISRDSIRCGAHFFSKLIAIPYLDRDALQRIGESLTFTGLDPESI